VFQLAAITNAKCCIEIHFITVLCVQIITASLTYNHWHWRCSKSITSWYKITGNWNKVTCVGVCLYTAEGRTSFVPACETCRYKSRWIQYFFITMPRVFVFSLSELTWSIRRKWEPDWVGFIYVESLLVEYAAPFNIYSVITWVTALAAWPAVV
jgi:hypothetical protein